MTFVCLTGGAAARGQVTRTGTVVGKGENPVCEKPEQDKIGCSLCILRQNGSMFSAISHLAWPSYYLKSVFTPLCKFLNLML